MLAKTPDDNGGEEWKDSLCVTDNLFHAINLLGNAIREMNRHDHGLPATCTEPIGETLAHIIKVANQLCGLSFEDIMKMSKIEPPGK